MRNVSNAKKYKLHKTESKHDESNMECEICIYWKVHNNKYIAAREEYKKDGTACEKDKELFISADLQKVCLTEIVSVIYLIEIVLVI